MIPRLRIMDVSQESTGAGESLLALAYCPPGYSVTGGGFLKSEPGIEVRNNIPYTDETIYNIWSVDGVSTGPGQTVSAVAVCQRGQTLDAN